MPAMRDGRGWWYCASPLASKSHRQALRSILAPPAWAAARTSLPCSTPKRPSRLPPPAPFAPRRSQSGSPPRLLPPATLSTYTWPGSAGPPPRAPRQSLLHEAAPSTLRPLRPGLVANWHPPRARPTPPKCPSRTACQPPRWTRSRRRSAWPPTLRVRSRGGPTRRPGLPSMPPTCRRPTAKRSPPRTARRPLPTLPPRRAPPALPPARRPRSLRSRSRPYRRTCTGRCPRAASTASCGDRPASPRACTTWETTTGR